MGVEKEVVRVKGRVVSRKVGFCIVGGCGESNYNDSVDAI